MIKPIVTDKKQLSQICKLIRDPEDALHAGHVINNLRDTAASLTRCAGLAAPQIGHMVRIILVNVQGQAVIMINPEYTERKGKLISGQEGCFSVPGTSKKPVMVRRCNKIKIKYLSEDGSIKTGNFKSFEARLIQHEIDHLDGKLIS